MRLFVWIFFLVLVLLYQLKAPEGFTPVWGEYETKDYAGNDIQNYPSIGLNECKKNCIGNKDCKGIVMDTQSGNGNCWLKNDMTTGVDNDQRWAYKISRR